MQIDPLPIPTLSPSTPASMRFLAWAAVTTESKIQIKRWNLPRATTFGNAVSLARCTTSTQLPPALIINNVYSSLTVTADDLKIGVFGLDVFDHFELIDGVTLGGILRARGSITLESMNLAIIGRMKLYLTNQIIFNRRIIAIDHHTSQ